MKEQKNTFLTSEGDQWFQRNKEAYKNPKNSERVIVDVLKNVGLNPKIVLEIGSSNGVRLNAINHAFGSECFGIDPSASAVADGNLIFSNLNLQVATAESLPFSDCMFDTIVFGFCLCYCDRKDLFKIAREADRCLSENGYLVIMDFCPPFAYRNAYVHKEGLYVYKMDYASLFTWNPGYSKIHRVTFTQEGFVNRRFPDKRVGITVLNKRKENSYSIGPYL